MQSPYHFERERAPAIQNLVHPIAAADEGNEVTRLKPVLIHMILDRLHPGLEDRTDNAAAPRLRPMSQARRGDHPRACYASRSSGPRSP